MNNKSFSITIASIIFGAATVFGATAYASSDHHGSSATAGPGMMTTIPETARQAMADHKGMDHNGHMKSAMTTASNQHNGMHGTGNTRSHMTGETGKTHQHQHGTAGHQGTAPTR